ncbi:MAG: alpha-L-arabinofuranosidase [Blautia sp.]|nr:alpha-L-arabinofuranosidase [Blautia sp.]
MEKEKGSKIQEGMIGLFFEDINYAADGGLYAEMIENRSFEFYDCYGDKGDYYVKPDPGYGWSPAQEGGENGEEACGHENGSEACDSENGCRMQYVMGSPLYRENPHYLRFTAARPGQGFQNQAYSGIYLEKGKEYKVSFYARQISYEGNFRILVGKEGKVYAEAEIPCQSVPKDSWRKWIRYELVLKAPETVKGGRFILLLDRAGTVEFDFISMMPADAAAGIFRRDLFERLKELHPGFLRFPGGCIIEGNTLENRYRWKESVGIPERRRANYNRWSLHGTKEENGWHTEYAHYNQTLGIGFYEYFLLCELIGASPLPVLNVGLACQYQSCELVRTDEPAFQEFLQDALDLIEFANGGPDTRWGGVRAQMGHPAPFGLKMVGIGNEQWETEQVDFYARYRLFEKAVHEKYPEIRLIGSAGPDITSEHYRDAWKFYHEEAAENPNFCYAVDEHYYVKPEWFYEHVDFYDEYPRNVKVFAGEYAARPDGSAHDPEANTLAGALAEAAFLTGIEKNADVVILASYAPLFARLGYAQWSPDMIWFDETAAYPSASYYVQKMYGENMGTTLAPMRGQEKELRKEGVYISLSLDEKEGEYILKAVNAAKEEKTLELIDEKGNQVRGNAAVKTLRKKEDAAETAQGCPEPVRYEECGAELSGMLTLAPESFTVLRVKMAE